MADLLRSAMLDTNEVLRSVLAGVPGRARRSTVSVPARPSEAARADPSRVSADLVHRHAHLLEHGERSVSNSVV